ncbi:hypothetical protein A2164_03785 [Candidatus Curtissbacteria bacterium RBG_13_35_7]|uniref:Methyltransferase type 11 domain-containing protein n=1 Tax=Candidatus Curtissbacteria bacterium RBG_13_35_7 TaxID=1797705 RepID=A0A1F5G342_9BACT|nr:MAG: hypothetical protein A2164_03785 [Candidatus Curtissbacteria bacterium RBG_13_35_7]
MSSLKRYYDKKSISYNIKKKRLNKILELAFPVKGKLVLDIGCSTGYLGSILQKKGAKVFGIDISKNAVKEARKQLFSAQELDLNEQKLPFKKNYFDLIIASEIIEHLFEPEKILKEIHRILKINGYLLITTPNFLYWGHRIQFLKGEFEYQEEGPFDRSHIHFFTYLSLFNHLINSEFIIEAENHLYPGAKIFNIIKKLFPSLFAYQFVILAKKYRI